MLERRKWSCMESVARPTGRSGGSSEIRWCLGVERGEEAVSALDLPVFETAGPAAAGTIPGHSEGEVLKEKGKAKEESL